MPLTEFDLRTAEVLAKHVKDGMKAKGRMLYRDEVNAIIRRWFRKSAEGRKEADKWVGVFERALYREF